MKKDLKSFFAGKKVLITGHTGFKGAWLSQVLLSWGADLVGLGLKPHTEPNLFNLLALNKQMRSYLVDIRLAKKVTEIIEKEKPEIVFHLAAQALVHDSYDHPHYTLETNIMGSVNVLEALRQAGCARAAVFITTDKVYEDSGLKRPFQESDRLGGWDPYSSSKAAAELAIASYIKSFFNPSDYPKKHQTLIASARAGNVIGGGDWARDRLIPDIVRATFERGSEVIVRNPNSIRPWQHVLEPLHGYLMLAAKLYQAEKSFSGGWNFGPEKNNNLTVREVLEKMFEQVGRGGYVIRPEKTKKETNLLLLNSNKAKRVLGWNRLMTTGQTIQATADWYKNFYQKGDSFDFTNQQINSFF